MPTKNKAKKASAAPVEDRELDYHVGTQIVRARSYEAACAKAAQPQPQRTDKQLSWLWPNRTIGKRESGYMREEHNRLVNDFYKLQQQRDALQYELGGIYDALEAGDTVTIEPGSVKAGRIEAAIARVKAERRAK